MKSPAIVSILLAAVSMGVAPLIAHAQDQQLPCSEEPTDMTMGVGDIINCSISPVADTDLFRFEGTMGDWLMLTLTDRSGGSPAPTAEILDPDGAPIDTLLNQDSGERLILDVAMTGTHTVLVREAGDNQTVGYNLALQSVFPDPAETIPLEIDGEITQSIDVIADSDVVQFEGEASTTIILTLTDRTGGSPAPVVEVYDPDRELAQTWVPQDTGEAWQVELSNTGTYTLLLVEAGDNQTVAYNLALQRLFPPPASAPCIQYGDVIDGETISPVADSDVYLFEGEAGTQIILTLNDNTGGSPTPTAEIYDPSGQLVETLINQDGSDSWQATLSMSGTYEVLVREAGFNQTVTYNLALQCVLPSPDACPICEATPTEATSWGAVKSRYR